MQARQHEQQQPRRLQEPAAHERVLAAISTFSQPAPHPSALLSQSAQQARTLAAIERRFSSSSSRRRPPSLYRQARCGRIRCSAHASTHTPACILLQEAAADAHAPALASPCRGLLNSSALSIMVRVVCVPCAAAPQPVHTQQQRHSNGSVHEGMHAPPPTLRPGEPGCVQGPVGQL